MGAKKPTLTRNWLIFPECWVTFFFNFSAISGVYLPILRFFACFPRSRKYFPPFFFVAGDTCKAENQLQNVQDIQSKAFQFVWLCKVAGKCDLTTHMRFFFWAFIFSEKLVIYDLFCKPGRTPRYRKLLVKVTDAKSWAWCFCKKTRR